MMEKTEQATARTPRIAPLAEQDLPADLSESFAAGRAMMGFTGNDGLTLARRPELLKALGALVRAAYAPGQIPIGLKKMVALVTSEAAGCVYCSAHTANGALREGVDADKLAAIWAFEHDDRFTPGERAALRLAMAAAQSPSAADDALFAELREFYDDDALAELMGVIALFGFLNRWNDTVGTRLEAMPADAWDKIKSGRSGATR